MASVCLKRGDHGTPHQYISSPGGWGRTPPGWGECPLAALERVYTTRAVHTGPSPLHTRSPMAMTYRPSSWIGTPSRPAVPKDIQVSNGPQATMSPAIQCCGSGVTRPPVAPVPPVTSVPPPQRRHANSPSAPKPTTKRSRRQETPAFKAQYALRSGVESTLSQGIRRFAALRQSRSHGLARTHLQQLLTATARNLVRVIAWLKGEPGGERRDTLRGWRHIPYHVRQSFIKGTEATASDRGTVCCPTGAIVKPQRRGYQGFKGYLFGTNRTGARECTKKRVIIQTNLFHKIDEII